MMNYLCLVILEWVTFHTLKYLALKLIDRTIKIMVSSNNILRFKAVLETWGQRDCQFSSMAVSVSTFNANL